MIVKNKIIGHRGASMFAPENSASSLEVAFSMGLKWIETDVQITLDNKLVIFHDEKLDRTSNGEGFLALKKLSELKKLDIGAWFSEEFTGEKILTLVGQNKLPLLKALLNSINRNKKLKIDWKQFTI